MVNRRRSYTLHFLLLAVLTTVALAAVNYLAMAHRARLDLTADKRFTLSDGTRAMLDSLTEPIHVTYYIDEEPPPKRINLERDVRDKLQELAATSEGKLTWSIERVSNSQASAVREELRKRNIVETVDVLTSGDEESAQMRGFQGYFSSLEVRYGMAEPMPINGIRNVVDAMDEMFENRVDTLEFDIMFAVLQMRSKVPRTQPHRMVRSLDSTLKIEVLLSEQMPASNVGLGATILDAMNELVRAGAGKVELETMTVPWNGRLRQGRFEQITQEPTVDPKEPSRTGQNFYYAIVQLTYGERLDLVFDFRGQNTASLVLSHIEERLWELVKPRTKLGFILPPGSAAPSPQGGPPQTPYTDAFLYIQRAFGYDTVLLDLPRMRRIPRDLSCLIVFEPNRISERELYEVDRYLAEGGNVVMLYQGWQAQLNSGMSAITGSLRLTKTDTLPHFEQWAASLGLEFGQELLIDRDGSMAPYSQDPRTGMIVLVPTSVPLAVTVQPGDINGASVIGRKLASMPLPLAVSLKVDNDKLAAMQVQRDDVITARGEIYRFIPANPSFPELPLNLRFEGSAAIQDEPDAETRPETRLQRVAEAPVLATTLRGAFRSYWDNDERKVPAWAEPGDDPLAGARAPEIKSRPGTLVVCGSAGTLNIDYLYGYPRQVAVNEVIPTGTNFFRNVAETFIYGEDLTNLRVRTGIAPRITGNVSDRQRMFWLLLCIAGVPLLLLGAGAARTVMRTRARQAYESSQGGGTE